MGQYPMNEDTWLVKQGKALATLGFERVNLPLDPRMLAACPEAVFRAAVDTSMPLYEIGLDSQLMRVYVHWTDLFFHVDEEHLGTIETTCVEAALGIARFAPFESRWADYRGMLAGPMPFPGTGYSDDPNPIGGTTVPVDPNLIGWFENDCVTAEAGYGKSLLVFHQILYSLRFHTHDIYYKHQKERRRVRKRYMRK